jgi:YbbR domain-containing protein
MKKALKLILDNFYLKAISILIAFLLWLNLNYFERTKFEIVVPIEVINLPENYKVESVNPSKVNILVEGNIKNLSKLKLSKIRAYCDASNVKVGENKLPVVVHSQEKSLSIKKIEPLYVKVFITHK